MRATNKSWDVRISARVYRISMLNFGAFFSESNLLSWASCLVYVVCSALYPVAPQKFLMHRSVYTCMMWCLKHSQIVPNQFWLEDTQATPDLLGNNDTWLVALSKGWTPQKKPKNPWYQGPQGPRSWFKVQDFMRFMSVVQHAVV